MKMGTSSGTTHDGPAANVSYCLKHSRSKTGGGSADAEREMSEELPTIAPNNRKRKLMSYDERHRSTESSTPQPEPIPKPQQNGMGGSNSKQSRAYGKAFTGGGPPIIPQYIFDKVYDYVKPIQIRNKKKQFINQVCRYWSLKRDSRRGAPLLKRLHLEVRESGATSCLCDTWQDDLTFFLLPAVDSCWCFSTGYRPREGEEARGKI